ncbi:MAG TPA: molybdopterin molybdenumtransferase MoeA, partial [Burkholderiaceae bacterium]
MTLAQIASCVAGYDPNALPVAQARNFIARLVPAVRGIESVAIRSALGRVLARDVISPIAVPAADNSAMDGYALRGSELSAEHATTFRVVGKGYAGDAAGTAVVAGECVRIMTGAVMPPGLDTVVPQEFIKGYADAGADGER